MNIVFRVIMLFIPIPADLRARIHRRRNIGEYDRIMGRLAVAPYQCSESASLPVVMPGKTQEVRLQHLAHLYSMGLVTTNEYGASRRQILREL